MASVASIASGTATAGGNSACAAVSTIADEEPARTAGAAGAAGGSSDACSAITAVAEPTCRATISAVVTISAVADQPAVAAGARCSPSAGLSRPGITVADQDSAVGMLSCTVAEQEAPYATHPGRRARGGAGRTGAAGESIRFGL
jgi:hypothetical protein